MPEPTLDSFYRAANLVVAVTALAVAALIVVELRRRPARRREPLGVVLAVMFIAIGVRAALRVQDTLAPPDYAVTIVVIEWLSAAAMVAFLALRRRYALFIESAEMMREYETGYAEKAREASTLAQINEELRRLDELKSQFLAMVSHELRTPLTAIIGYSRLLMRQLHGPLSAKQLEHQEAIFRGALRLSDLINDLLDVSRLEAGRVEVHARPSDARYTVDQVIAVVRAAAHAKQIRLTNDLPSELPSVQADPTRLHQILANLLSNAVKFTPPGGSVRVNGGATKDQVWIAVEDTGVGIAHDELARIWEAFYQVESPMRRGHGGSGLGLAIVRRLVELHGGVVRAESEGENRGSRFVFTLPIAQGPAGLEAPTAPEPELEPILAGRDVIIVEDEKNNQDLMRAVVEDLLGGQARVCDDGYQALEAALERPPALILLDLMLPQLSGWEVARRLRQNHATRTVPIIAVSALARTQDREMAMHAGCDAYVSKPFTPDQLARAIAAAVIDEGVPSP